MFTKISEGPVHFIVRLLSRIFTLRSQQQHKKLRLLLQTENLSRAPDRASGSIEKTTYVAENIFLHTNWHAVPTTCGSYPFCDAQHDARGREGMLSCVLLSSKALKSRYHLMKWSSEICQSTLSRPLILAPASKKLIASVVD